MSERQEIANVKRSQTREVSEMFGISFELVRESSAWARQWQLLLDEYDFTEEEIPTILPAK